MRITDGGGRSGILEKKSKRRGRNVELFVPDYSFSGGALVPLVEKKGKGEHCLKFDKGKGEGGGFCKNDIPIFNYI